MNDPDCTLHVKELTLHELNMQAWQNFQEGGEGQSPGVGVYPSCAEIDRTKNNQIEFTSYHYIVKNFSLSSLLMEDKLKVFINKTGPRNLSNLIGSKEFVRGAAGTVF